MQLQLRPAGDGRTMYLTDLRGRALPGQVAVAWTHDGPGDYAQAVVTFFIDGTEIVVVADPIETGNGTLPDALDAFALLSDANKLRFIEAARPAPVDRGRQLLAQAFDALRAAVLS